MLKKEIWDFVESKIKNNVQEIGKNFPASVQNGEYVIKNSRQWTAGFWPGILWQAYQVTENETYAMLARELEAELDDILSNPEYIDQSSGMIWTLVSLADYKLTENLEARRRALLAANLLMARFNLAGDFICSSSNQGMEINHGLVTIDSVMDMALLFWATAETGDPRYKHIAEAHLSTIINHFVREDGSVHFACSFHPETGLLIEESNDEHKEEKAATGGAAWAIYGFALAARYTRRPEYVDATKLIAETFMEQNQDPLSKNPTAAAIAANSLLTLAKLTGVKNYYESAISIITDLYDHHSTKESSTSQNMLKEGTGNQSQSETSGITADYFFTEAVVTVLFDKDLFW